MTSPFTVKGPATLPAEVVYRVLDVMERHGYDNEISFHQYSEPLMDPRLFEFIRRARQACPSSTITILTNGHYLTSVLAKELRQAGVSQLLITPYGSSSERKAKTAWVTREIAAQFSPGACRCVAGKLDSRLTWYDREPIDSNRPCYAPLGSLGITCRGEVSLCCLDWQRRYNFGSLLERDLEEILVSDQVQETYQQLSRGERFLDLCRRCTWARGG